MRLSVEMDEGLLREVMRLTGETKMSAAVAKAAELFANRRKAVAIVRSLREDPLDYEWTNEEIESWGEGASASTTAEKKSLAYPKKKKTR